ncbi:MAG: SDR family oxidoreductase, partial [Elusimicrobiota bacterium]
MKRVLLTGFPGFIGSRIIDRLLRRDADLEVICLVQPKFMEKAAQDTAALSDGARVRVVPGDISKPRFGLTHEAYKTLAGDIEEVWYLAAIYDLTISATIANRVNVGGTLEVLDF